MALLLVPITVNVEMATIFPSQALTLTQVPKSNSIAEKKGKLLLTCSGALRAQPDVTRVSTVRLVYTSETRLCW